MPPATENAGVLSVSRFETVVEHLFQNNFDADTKVYVTTLLKVIDNILTHPYNPNLRQLKASNSSIKSKLLARQGGLQVLLACGFVAEGTGSGIGIGGGIGIGVGGVLGSSVLPDNDNSPSSLERLVYPHDDVSFLRTVRRHLVQRLVRDLNVPSDQMPKEPPFVVPLDQALHNNSSHPFNVYAGHRYDAASAALGVQVAPEAQYVSKTETALRALTEKQRSLEQELRAKGPIERQWKAFRPGEVAPTLTSTSTTTSSSSTAVEPTNKGSDSGLLAAKLQKQQKERTRNDSGFTTQAMRDVERLQKAKVYSHTVLTLQFPDGAKVLGCFGLHETIAAVCDALRNDCFDSSVVAGELDLIQTPPRRVLDPKQSLQQLGLVPAAKVVVSWKKAPQPPSPSGNAGPGWYLQQHLFPSDPASSSSTTTAAAAAASSLFPSSRPVVDPGVNDASAGAAAPSTDLPPVPPESREEALLRRMMGGGGGLMGGGGRRLGGGGGTASGEGGAPLGSNAGTNPKKDPAKKPKWFKG